MIYCTERKIGVFLNPKTGSHTIKKVFDNIPVTLAARNHSNYSIAEYVYEIPDFSTYKFFCFYRDPVDRFDSAFKFYKRAAYAHCLNEFFSSEDRLKARKEVKKAMHDQFLDQSKRYDDEYHWLSQESKEKIESISVSQILNYFTFEKINGNPAPENFFTDRYFQNTPSVFMNQKFWLDFNIDLTLLNFADFENQLRYLVSHFGTTLDVIPNINENIIVENDHVLTTEEIQLVRQFYQPDYDFFASKGITF